MGKQSSRGKSILCSPEFEFTARNVLLVKVPFQNVMGDYT